LLDVGGVLLLPDHRAIKTALEDVDVRADPPSFDRAQYVAMAAADAAASQAEGLSIYWEAFVGALGVPDEALAEAVAALRRVFVPGSRTWNRPVMDSVEALRRLVGRKTQVAVVSNASETLEEELRQLEICQVGPGPGTEVDAVIVSDVVGVEKPDPAIFRIALATIGVEARDAVHVGDSVRFDVDGARNAGVEPIHFDPYRVCRRRGHQHLASLHELL
jgi:putative hydrolase of the HAD superfamily